MKLTLSAIAVTAALAFAALAQSEAIDWDKMDSTLGRKSAVAGGVHRYGFPRTDLSVTVDGVAI